MKKTRKILALLLSICMIVTMLPTVAFAAEGDPVTVTTEADLKKNLEDGKSVKLGGAITLNATINISSGKDVVLDLNGQTITITQDTNHYTIMVAAGGTLTLTDGVGSEPGGKITVSQTVQHQLIEVDGGTLNIEGGEIAMDAATDPSMNAVAVRNSGKITMSGGKITGTTKGSQNTGMVGLVSVSGESSSFTMSGGEIKNNGTTKFDAAINNGVTSPGKKGGTVTIQDSATVTGGTGISVFNEGKVNVEGGNIAGNEEIGFGINAGGSTTTNVSGGEVTGYAGIVGGQTGCNVNISDDAEIGGVGVGVQMGQGTLTVKDGSITSTEEEGAGVIVLGGGTANIEGGEISGETGVYSHSVKSSVTGGNITITDGKITGTKGPAVAQAKENANDSKGTISIMDGEFVSSGDGNKDIDVDTSVKNFIKGGHFSQPVDKDLLDTSLTAQLQSNSSDTPYSYYPSVAEAEKAAAGDSSATVTVLDGKASIVVAGFKADADEANEAIEAGIKKVKDNANTKVTDSGKNTMYAVWKANGTESTKYYVETKLGDKVIHTGGVVTTGTGGFNYFSFENKGQVSDNVIKTGKYVMTLYTTTQATATQGTEVSKAEVEIYSIKYDDGEGSFAEGAATELFGMKDDLKRNDPTPIAPSGKVFDKWTESAGDDEYTTVYTATYKTRSTGGSTTPSYTVTPPKHHLLSL